MYQNTCGAAAASAGGCVETERECHSLISKEPPVPAIEHDYSGFDVVKATQVKTNFLEFSCGTKIQFLVWSIFKSERTCRCRLQC